MAQISNTIRNDREWGISTGKYICNFCGENTGVGGWWLGNAGKVVICGKKQCVEDLGKLHIDVTTDRLMNMKGAK